MVHLVGVADRHRRRPARHDRAGGGELGGVSRLARSRRQLALLPRPLDHALDLHGARTRRARHRPAPLHAEPHRAGAVRRAIVMGALAARRSASRAAAGRRPRRRHRRRGDRHARRGRRARLAATFGRDRPAASSRTRWRSSAASSSWPPHEPDVRRDRHRRRPGRPAARRPADRRRHEGRRRSSGSCSAAPASTPAARRPRRWSPAPMRRSTSRGAARRTACRSTRRSRST